MTYLSISRKLRLIPKNVLIAAVVIGILELTALYQVYVPKIFHSEKSAESLNFSLNPNKELTDKKGEDEEGSSEMNKYNEVTVKVEDAFFTIFFFHCYFIINISH